MRQTLINMLFRGLLSCCILFAAGKTQAQDEARLTRNINRQYKVPADVTVDIDNKYGRVVVKSWPQDSVVIAIEITAYARDSRSVQKMIERVEVDFRDMGSFLTAETVLDRGNGTFKDLMNTVGDYSKTLISKNKISIDYEITIPEKGTLYLANKFGNVFIADHAGPVKLTLAHGDLKANELTGSAVLNLSFGKANIRKMQEVELTLKAAQVDIQQANSIHLESMTSELRVENALSARINSRNDKLNFQKIGWISGKGMFTDWVFGELLENLDLEVNYGQIYLQQLHNDFANVQVMSKYSDVDLTLDPACWVNLDIKAAEDKIFIPANWFPMLEHIPLAGKDGYLQLKGEVGRSNASQGNIQLDLQDASVTIHYQEALPLTKN